MKLANLLLRFLFLTGLAFVLGVIGIGLCIIVLLCTYYTLIML